MKPSRLVSGVLAIALIGTVTTVLALRMVREERIPTMTKVSSESATGTGDRWPVFYIDDATSKPEDCAGVDIEMRSDGLFQKTARSADKSRIVQVRVHDESFESFSDTVGLSKSVGQQLRIVARAVGGTELENRALAEEVLRTAQLEQPGNASSLSVVWPGSLTESSAGVLWRISGELMAESGIYIAPDAEPAASKSEEIAAGENVVQGDSSRSREVTLHWSSINEFDEGTFEGFFAAAVGTKYFFGHRKLGDFATSVGVAGDGATQGVADRLAAQVQEASFTCPATTPGSEPDLRSMTRVVGDNLVAYIPAAQPQGTRCFITKALIVEKGFVPRPYDFDCSPGGNFAVSSGAETTSTTEGIFVFARTNVNEVRVRGLSTNVLARKALVQPEGSPYALGAVEFSKPNGINTVLLDAFGDNSLVESASYRLGCVYHEACSPLASLLDTPATNLSDPKNPTRSELLYLGAVSKPSKDWTYAIPKVGTSDLANATPHWCALLDIHDQRPNLEGRDGLSSCVALNELRPNTLAPDTATLDYVGAVSMTVVVVGPNVNSVHVRSGEVNKTFNVHRRAPGPGAVAFEDPSNYGEHSVTYEGLDKSGNVIATA